MPGSIENPHGHRTLGDAIRCTVWRRAEAEIIDSLIGSETPSDRGLCISFPRTATDTTKGVAGAHGQPRASQGISANDDLGG